MIRVLSRQINTPQELTTMACGVLIVGLLIVYVYCMNATVRQVALRQELEVASRSLVSEVSTLEFAYMDLKNEITLDDAHAFGFVEAPQMKVVTRGVLAPNVSAVLQ